MVPVLVGVGVPDRDIVPLLLHWVGEVYWEDVLFPDSCTRWGRCTRGIGCPLVPVLGAGDVLG